MNHEEINQVFYINNQNLYINGGQLHYKGILLHKYAVLAKIDNIVIGYALLITGFLLDNDLYVMQVAVNKLYQYKGVGSKLYQYFFKHLKGYKIITANVKRR